MKDPTLDFEMFRNPRLVAALSNVSGACTYRQKGLLRHGRFKTMAIPIEEAERDITPTKRIAPSSIVNTNTFLFFRLSDFLNRWNQEG